LGQEDQLEFTVDADPTRHSVTVNGNCSSCSQVIGATAEPSHDVMRATSLPKVVECWLRTYRMDEGEVSVAILGSVDDRQWLLLAFPEFFGAPLLHCEFESLEAARLYVDDWANAGLSQDNRHPSGCEMWQIERAVRS
jgi:hypothetical protein